MTSRVTLLSGKRLADTVKQQNRLVISSPTSMANDTIANRSAETAIHLRRAMENR